MVTLLGALRLLAPQSAYPSRALCKVLGISQRHLQRILPGAIGSTPREWVSEERILEARELLGGGRIVKEVAAALEFRTVSQLSRDFERRFGVTPTAARAEAARMVRAAADIPPSSRRLRTS